MTFSRAQAQTDSNGLTDTNGIVFANEALVDFHRKLVNKGVDASQLQESFATATIPAAGDGSTFLYPTDMLALKTIEVNFMDATAQNYIRANQIDVSNLPSGESFSYYRQYANTNSPLFDDRGDWYEIFPAFISGNNLTNAIRLFYFIKPTEYTSTSDTIAYPVSQDYRILGWRIVSDYYYSLGKFEEGDAFNAKYEERVTEYTATLGRGSSQPITATVPNVGNDGWDF